MALSELEKLTRAKARLEYFIKKEEEKETVRWSKMTWGQGMRHSKLPNTSGRLSDLECRLGKLTRQIELIQQAH